MRIQTTVKMNCGNSSATQNFTKKNSLNCGTAFLTDVRGLILLMWGCAVNRQPGYRARNLQRRGYRTPPPRSKILLKKNWFFSEKNWKKSTHHEWADPATFSIPRDRQSTWDFQETSLTPQRTWGFKPESKWTVQIPARDKTSPK